MSATLRISSNVLAFDDQDITSDPSQKYVDWSRSTVVSVENPQQLSYTIPPSGMISVFAGSRTTSIDNTTQFNFTISPLTSNRYRFTWSGTGTNPVLRVNRNLTPNGHTLTWSINSNQTATLTSNTSGEFTAVQVGDTLFVPGISTGDSAGPFNVLNEGFWQVLGTSGTALQLARFNGEYFDGYGQVVTATSNTNLVAFAADGVQVGDTVNISAGFSSQVLKSFTVDTVTPTWFEILTTSPLPVGQTGIPGTTGMIFYFDFKRFMKIEADQECVVRLNGDTSDINRLSPWANGDKNYVAEFLKVGAVWSIVVVNKSTNILKLLVITAE